MTESVLSLNDMAVLVRQAQNVLYCSKSIVSVLGVDSKLMTTLGWAYLHSTIHPADQKLLEKKGWPALRNFLKALPKKDRNRCTFNYTARVKHHNGGDVLVAFENQPMEWPIGNWPNTYLTVLKNISPYGNKEKMILTVSLQNEQGRYEVVHQQSFDFTYEPFTLREVEIVRLIATGLTSKQMASHLKLSMDTVRNHRKHILKKASCSSSTELTSFAIQIGIL